ncbi:putative taxadien-5-alpha-ol O-acetyltransferase [Dioscorea sansibarensis]
MNFPVTKLSESFVKPCEPTPCDTTLPLSSLDKFPTLRSPLLETLLVFKYGQEPEKIIKVALSKALVHYYPVAGDFSVSDQGELEIACTSRGVWFVEAYADCRLEDFDYLDNPYVIPRHYLIPQPPSVVEDPTSIFFSFQVRIIDAKYFGIREKVCCYRFDVEFFYYYMKIFFKNNFY